MEDVMKSITAKGYAADHTYTIKFEYIPVREKYSNKISVKILSANGTIFPAQNISTTSHH
jgi:hypothetical protein